MLVHLIMYKLDAIQERSRIAPSHAARDNDDNYNDALRKRNE